jgi:two-component system, NtrC family, sensor kinase
MKKQATSQQVRLETQLDPNLPEITSSPSEIQQVLLNLINNAIASMEDAGGRIRIGTSTAEHPEIGQALLLQVADNGPGISKDILPHIFEPFFTTKPVGKGTGLGLSICYGIVKKLYGDITVESVPGQGATFSVHLPVHAPDTERKGQRTVL